MEPSVFTNIINGDIPCHKVYEDDATLAFLDIHPARPGHTLVVPKKQVDRLEDLDSADYAAVMATVQKLMLHIRQTLGAERVCLKVIGFDVPHAHVHLLPCDTGQDFWTREDFDAEPDHTSLTAMAERLYLD